MAHLKRNGMLSLSLLFSIVTVAQNLVVNHSFEEVKFLHEGPMWKTSNGTEFTDMSVGWLSPHGSSPDYLDHEKGRTYIFKEYNHTDSLGEGEFNIELSKKRSEAIRTFLVKQGIDSKRKSTNSWGGTPGRY